MTSPRDPRLRPLVLEGSDLATRDAELRATGLSPEALSQVQQWTGSFIRFGPVPGSFKTKRLVAVVASVVIILAGSWFAWLEQNPNIKTSPEGGGYYAAVVFILAGLGLLVARRWMVPGRYRRPRVLVDLEHRTTRTPRGPERPWTETRWVLYKWHSHAGMADTATTMEFALLPSWDLSGFDTQHPSVAHHALSNHRHPLLEDMSLPAAMELAEKLVEIGVCHHVDIDPPIDGRDTSPEIESLIRPGFRLWRPRG